MCILDTGRSMNRRMFLEPAQERSSKALQRAEGGNERGGFEISVDKMQRVVHARLWGVWHVPVAEQFVAALKDCGQGFAGKTWAIVAESSHFGAQSQEVARIRREGMAALRTLGCEKIASIRSNVIHAMQFKRISDESHVSSEVFPNEKLALEWIRASRR